MITVAIPTYRRGAIALATIKALRSLERPPDAIIIADQTLDHPADVEASFRQLAESGAITWLRLDAPSIPRAMNRALVAARSELVLFLDDDIEPHPSLITAHEQAHAARACAAVAGQVLQPGEEPSDATPRNYDLEFLFSSSRPAIVRNVMAGNLSVRRTTALSIGGFDENFVGVAYRFETDFAYRLAAAGEVIRFEPSASIRHLKLGTGGLRAYGDHRTSMSPMHSVGDYYFAARHLGEPVRYSLARLRKNVLTRFHLRHPWTIPSKLVGELRGLLLARQLLRSGPSLLGPPESSA